MPSAVSEEPKVSFPIVSYATPLLRTITTFADNNRFDPFLNGDEEEQKVCAQKLYDAFHNFGWIYLKDFGITMEEVDEMFAWVSFSK
jgi:hypothetical protein